MNELIVLKLSFEGAGGKNVICPVLLKDETELVLIDCGYPNSLPLIKEAAEAKGIDISELTKIIITHHDFDHMGALAQFKKAYPQIQVLASRQEEPYISGKNKSLRLQQAEALYDKLPEEHKENAKKFQEVLAAVENVEVDTCLTDRDFFSWCGSVEIVATPGHMPGHISIYVKDSKTLISGDAMVAEKGKLLIANPQYTLDMGEAKRSIEKLLNYEINRIICYHGGICTENIKESMKQITKE